MFLGGRTSVHVSIKLSGTPHIMFKAKGAAHCVSCPAQQWTAVRQTAEKVFNVTVLRKQLFEAESQCFPKPNQVVLVDGGPARPNSLVYYQGILEGLDKFGSNSLMGKVTITLGTD